MVFWLGDSISFTQVHKTLCGWYPSTHFSYSTDISKTGPTPNGFAYKIYKSYDFKPDLWFTCWFMIMIVIYDLISD